MEKLFKYFPRRDVIVMCYTFGIFIIFIKILFRIRINYIEDECYNTSNIDAGKQARGIKTAYDMFVIVKLMMISQEVFLKALSVFYA